MRSVVPPPAAASVPPIARAVRAAVTATDTQHRTLWLVPELAGLVGLTAAAVGAGLVLRLLHAGNVTGQAFESFVQQRGPALLLLLRIESCSRICSLFGGW